MGSQRSRGRRNPEETSHFKAQDKHERSDADRISWSPSRKSREARREDDVDCRGLQQTKSPDPVPHPHPIQRSRGDVQAALLEAVGGWDGKYSSRAVASKQITHNSNSKQKISQPPRAEQATRTTLLSALCPELRAEAGEAWPRRMALPVSSSGTPHSAHTEHKIQHPRSSVQHLQPTTVEKDDDDDDFASVHDDHVRRQKLVRTNQVEWDECRCCCRRALGKIYIQLVTGFFRFKTNYKPRYNNLECYVK